MGLPVRQVAEDVWQIPLAPRSAVNAYLVGDVLVDAGTAGMGRRLPGLLAGRPVAAHAITHAHPDHVGGSAHVCAVLGVPFWAPAGDAQAAEDGHPPVQPGPGGALLARVSGFPPVRVDRRLAEGDEVGGFRVLDAPGHSPGQVVLWRAADRVLVCGDVVFGMRLATLRPDLREPPRLLTADPRRNRISIRRLAMLEPELLLPGHGPPLRAAAPRLRALGAARR